MKKNTMQLLTTAANMIKPHLYNIKTSTSPKEAAILLNNTLRITLTPAEIDGFKEAEDTLLFLLRGLGIRIGLTVKNIDWWYYNRYLKGEVNK
jgi:hypothetical protein